MVRNHRYLPWRRAFLIPIWTIQLGSMGLIIALLAFAAGLLFRYDEYLSSSTKSAAKTAVAIWCSLSAFCILLTISNIVLLMRRNLKPLSFLIISVVQSVIWTGLFILDALSWAKDTVTAETAVGIIIELVAVLSFYAGLVYGAIIYHRFRKEKKSYNPLAQPSHDTTYQSQLHNIHDVESSALPPPLYGGPQSSGVTPAYDPYKPAYDNHGDLGLASQQQQNQTYRAPQTGVYEMDTRRGLQ